MEDLERKTNSKNKKLSPTDSGINHLTDSQSDQQSWGSSPVSSFGDSKISLTKPETPKSLKYKASISKILGSGVLRFGREKAKNKSETNDGRKSTLSRTESIKSSGSDYEYPSIQASENVTDLFRKFSLTALYQTNEIQVNVKWGDQSINTKIQASMIVSSAIEHIIKIDKVCESFMHSTDKYKTEQTAVDNDISNMKSDISERAQLVNGTKPEEFLLGKKDRQNPGMRVWFHPKAPVSMYALKQGDELILQHVSHSSVLRYIVPPSDLIMEIRYDNELTVQNAIKEMKRMRNLEDQAYGLYNPQIGMWLDGSKQLVAYYLENQILEFRALANEFLVRISLPDFNQKIGIKVLPTFLVADVLSIITFQLHNRKLILPKQGLYGLFTPSNNQWLLEQNRIDFYDSVKTETLVFQLQYEFCNIRVNFSQFVQMLVGNSCTAGDILNLFIVNHALPLDQDYALYAGGGNLMLSEDQKMMDFLKNMTAHESIMIQMRPISVGIFTSFYPGLLLSFDLDISRSLSSYISYISRKFGFPEDVFLQINIEGNPLPLDIEESIARLKIVHSTKLEVHWDQTKKKHLSSTEKPSKPTNASTVTAYDIEEMIDMLTDPLKDQSTHFLNTFLLIFKKFISAEDLIRKLTSRYVPINYSNLSWSNFEANRKSIQIRVANSIIQWIKKFPQDFISEKTELDNAQTILDFVDEIVEGEHPTLANQIRKAIEKISLHPIDNDFGMKYAKYEISDELTSNNAVFNCSPIEIAENLTIIESHFYSSLNPSELLNQAWSKKDALINAPGIVALSRRFNSVASWIVQCILDMTTPKLRAERIGKIIEVASALFTLHNYSTLMAFIAGLNNACIARLHETQKALSSKTIKKKDELETLMSALGSYKNYRASIHKIQPPCIPYIGTYLMDLTYIEDGNPDSIDGLINFTKCEMISKVIREILDYQQCPYQLKSKQDICCILYNLPESSEAQAKVFWSQSKKYEQSQK